MQIAWPVFLSLYLIFLNLRIALGFYIRTGIVFFAIILNKENKAKAKGENAQKTKNKSKKGMVKEILHYF